MMALRVLQSCIHYYQNGVIVDPVKAMLINEVIKLSDEAVSTMPDEAAFDKQFSQIDSRGTLPSQMGSVFTGKHKSSGVAVSIKRYSGEVSGLEASLAAQIMFDSYDCVDYSKTTKAGLETHVLQEFAKSNQKASDINQQARHLIQALEAAGAIDNENILKLSGKFVKNKKLENGRSFSEYIIVTPHVGKTWSEGSFDGQSRQVKVAALKSVCEALAALHEHGIVHRAICPDSICVRNDDAAKPIIINLGHSRLPGDRVDPIVEFPAPFYLAPETKGNTNALTFSSDCGPWV